MSGQPGPGRGPVSMRRVGLFVGVPVVALLAIGIVTHVSAFESAEHTRDALIHDRPMVDTTTAKRLDGPVSVTLPAETQPFDSASIYARATGYIAERRVDIGSRVHRGDLLVRISAPDTDAQLAEAVATLGQLKAALLQARATVLQSEANSKLADKTRYRSTTLAGEGWATRQNADNDVANAGVQTAGVAGANAGVAVAEANIRAQEATVGRLGALVGFERVVAPFDGVITARTTDIGDLVQADQSTGGGTALFSEASDDVLRCSVYVPQSEAVGVRDGIEADVTVPEMPGRIFRGTVSRNAIAINDASRSLLTQIDIPNRDHVLRPGLFVNITFKVPRPHPVVEVPDNAIIFDGSGTQVAVLDGDRVRLRQVSIDRDRGTVADIGQGLAGGERIVVNPPADLEQGQAVQVHGS